MCGIIKKETIIVDLDCQNKEEAIYLLCKQLKKAELLDDNELFYQEVINREKMFSTSIGKLIAIPHGRDDNVLAPSICFGRLKHSILWDLESEEYVKMIILIAIPKNNKDNIHLHIISHLMRQLMHDDFIGKLLIGNKNEILKTIEAGLSEV